MAAYILIEHAFNHYIDYIQFQIDEIERLKDNALNAAVAEEKQYKMKKFTTYTRKFRFDV